MKIKFPLLVGALSVLVLSTFNSQLSTAQAQGTTTFTYQGQLHDGGTNANGAYTMIFKLYDAGTSGNQIGGTITTSPTLANGLFSVNLDFGNGFSGAARWLDITVTNGGTTQELSPRVQLLPAPYAEFAAVAATVTNGSIMNAQIAPNAVATINIQNNAITTNQIAGGQVVKGLNGLHDAVTLSAGSNITLSTIGNTLQISAAAGGTNSSASATILTNAGWYVGLATFQSVPNVFGIYENNSLVLGVSPTGSADLLIPNELKLGNNSGFQISGVNDGFVEFGNNSGSISGDGNGGVNVTGNLSVSGSATAASFNTSSDRNIKEKFTPVDNQEILARVAGLPISSWAFKQDANTRHIGPMAQDFYAAFNVGTDNKHIATVDEDGVALAAIQGLNEKLGQKDAQIEALEKRLTDLEQLVKTSVQK
jgi:hypothetical protein